MESDAPESGWTDDDINNFFWFDFDTIADWLGYKGEKHFDADVRADDVKEAQDWFDERCPNNLHDDLMYPKNDAV